MKKTEWENAFGSVPQDFERSVTHQIQQIKEEIPVKKIKTFSIVAIACLITLIVAIAYAAVTQWSLPSFMERWFGVQMTEAGQQAMQTPEANIYFAETEDVTITIRQALYDGSTLHLMTATTPKQPDKVLLMLLDALPEDPACNLGLPALENDMTPIAETEIAKGKKLLGVEPSVIINGVCPDSAGHQALEEDGTLASWIQLAFEVDAEVQEVEIEYATYLWDKKEAPGEAEIQSVSFTFPLRVTALEQDAVMWPKPEDEA